MIFRNGQIVLQVWYGLPWGPLRMIKIREDMEIWKPVLMSFFLNKSISIIMQDQNYFEGLRFCQISSANDVHTMSKLVGLIEGCVRYKDEYQI